MMNISPHQPHAELQIERRLRLLFNLAFAAAQSEGPHEASSLIDQAKRALTAWEGGLRETTRQAVEELVALLGRHPAAERARETQRMLDSTLADAPADQPVARAIRFLFDRVPLREATK